MDATRLAAILSLSNTTNLEELYGDPSPAAIPALKMLAAENPSRLGYNVVYRKTLYAALGACVMAAEDELTDRQIDDYLGAVSPVSPSCICAVESERGPSASSLHASTGAPKTDTSYFPQAAEAISKIRASRAPETDEAIHKAKEILAEREQAGDERLLEDIAEARISNPRDVPEAQALIQRLCQLQSDVAAEVEPGATEPNDCFCGEQGYWPLKSADSFRSSGSAVDFIERAVRDALKDRRARDHLIKDLAECDAPADITTIRDEALRTLGSIMNCATERRDRIKAAEAILRHTNPSER